MIEICVHIYRPDMITVEEVVLITANLLLTDEELIEN
jgi:hypothetical protein